MIFRPFLVKYQDKKPLIPYMCNDLSKMIQQIIEIVIQGSILDKVSGFKLPRFDIKKETNHKNKKEFHLRLATNSILSNLKRQDVFDWSATSKFYTNVLLCEEATFKKLSTMWPLSSMVVGNVIIFNPSVMAPANKEVLAKKLKILF